MKLVLGRKGGDYVHAKEQAYIVEIQELGNCKYPQADPRLEEKSWKVKRWKEQGWSMARGMKCKAGDAKSKAKGTKNNVGNVMNRARGAKNEVGEWIIMSKAWKVFGAIYLCEAPFCKIYLLHGHYPKN